MRWLQLLVLVAVVGVFVASGQTMIHNFDSTATSYATVLESPSTLTLTYDPADKVEGTGSLNVNAKLASVHSWGTFGQVGYGVADGATPWDWTISDSISVWLKVRRAPTLPATMVFRINIVDRPTAADVKEEWIYENTTILDNVQTGWVRLRAKILERTQPPSNDLTPDSTGFVLAPGSWGLPRNNSKLDRDKVVAWAFNIVTGTIAADSVIVSFDKFERFGVRAIPAVIFNGKAFDGHITNVWSWGQSSVVVENNAGSIPNSNAVKWIQGNEWGNGWTGWGVDITNPRYNLAGAWRTDSLKLRMKCETGVDTLRAQFESGGDGKRGIKFKPIADNQWHEYVLALKDFVNQDNTTNFDSSSIGSFGIMAEATGIAGKVIYVDKIWTGNPTIDVIPPVAPTGLAVAGTNYTNLITWNPVPNEPGVRYNVFVKNAPWTNAQDSTVEDVPLYNLTSELTNHVLRSPNTDQTISYYYGVTAKDLAGNESIAAVATTATTTLAKGVPTISKTAPTNFTADGSLTEWASITPFDLSVVSGTAHSVPNFPISGDADLRVKCYLAVDAQYLYVAYDVTDDTVAVDTSATDYLQDCPDLCIGTYDWRGKHHSGYTRGLKPDYHIRFSKNRAKIDHNNNPILEPASAGNPNYIWKQKTLSSGYTVEARFSWTKLAQAITGGNDAVFVPREGMRIPMNIIINDRDNAAAGGERGGIMEYSILSNDNSWSDQYYWTHTWIGNQWTVDVKPTGELAREYALGQNYPNPFNPSTQIKYSVAKSGHVSLKIYDVLGREVTTLVNTNQEAGVYTVSFDFGKLGLSGLASGVYFYRLEAGSFTAVHKMMLMK